MVLQSYMAETGKVLQGATELVLCVIRIFVRSCPKVQIHINDLLTVEHYLDPTAFAGKRAAVPPAWFSNHVLRRFEAIVYCSGSALFGAFVSSERAAHLHFDTSIDGIL